MSIDVTITLEGAGQRRVDPNMKAAVYLAMSFTGLLLPEYEDKFSNIAFPALVGEMAFMLNWTQ